VDTRPYDLAQLTDVDVGHLLGKVEISIGPKAEDDLRTVVSELFGVNASVVEVKDNVWLVTIPMPAPRAGELEAIVIHGTQKLPDPIWRPRTSGFRGMLARLGLASRPAVSSPVVVYDLGRW
jgi:hypothetical protein